jgi:hypothetical protein
MVRKVKLDLEFDEDITIIGISCHKIDYWVARQINEQLKLKLTRQPDLSLFDPEKKSLINYPLFLFVKPEVQISFSLISNHNPEGKLFPDQKSFDYFMIIKGGINADEVSKWITVIKKIPQVLTAHNLNLKKIKNLQEFLSDLELHLIEIESKKKTKDKQFT